MPRTTKRTPKLDFCRAIEEFKQKHRHITYKPPRAKKDRIKNQIKNEHSFLYEYTEIEDRTPIKIEPSEDRNEFASRFVFELGEKIGLPFCSDGEMYTQINPVGRKYEGIIWNMDNGQTQQIEVFILPKIQN